MKECVKARKKGRWRWVIKDEEGFYIGRYSKFKGVGMGFVSYGCKETAELELQKKEASGLTGLSLEYLNIKTIKKNEDIIENEKKDELGIID